ncbi:MAG: glycosyl transferase [Methylobacter sp.]|nr:MAG: glycosyl transferase [Methylobacter sp.]
MANIVFCFPPIVSTINSSLRLARELKLRGHQITYLGIADCKPVICANGFEFVSIYEEWFPKGCFGSAYMKSQPSTVDDYSEDRNNSLRFNNFLDYLIAGGDDELNSVTRELNPDLIIVSTSLSDSVIWALFFHKLRLKVIYVFDVLGGCNNTVPPIHTELISDGSLWSSVKTILAWHIHKIKKIRHERHLVSNGLDLISSKKLKMLSEYCGYSIKDIDFWTDMPGFQLKLPELVLFPKRFDFPGVKKTGRYYAEASIDLDREQASFPWEKVIESQPIVYAALGTLPLLAKSDYENFFRIVIDASLKWPAWNWVLSIGNNLTVDDFESVPANVIIVNRAPQLELLKKASLMITHGGPNSVKECIFFGVPMIVFPLWFDQPGNVARVTYHGLGLKGDFKTITAKALQDLIEEVTVNPEFRERTKAMQKYFIETEQAKPSLQLIERFISQPNIPPFLN